MQYTLLFLQLICDHIFYQQSPRSCAFTSEMSLFTVVAVLGLAHISSLASASLSFIKRTGVQQPPCVYPYTEFVYSGCYADAVFNRSLPFETKLEFNNATVEQCTSWCKGNNYRYAGLEYYGV